MSNVSFVHTVAMTVTGQLNPFKTAGRTSTQARLQFSADGAGSASAK